MRMSSRLTGLCLSLLCAAALSPLLGEVKVAEQSGSVRVMTPDAAGRDGTWKVVAPGAVLEDDQVIVTSPGAKALLRYDDGTEISVASDSRLAVGARESGRGFLSLMAGSLVARVKKLTTVDDGFSIATPMAIAGVRGTVFSVTVGDLGETHVGVEEGRVAVAGADEAAEAHPVVTAGKAVEHDALGGRKEAGSFRLGEFRSDAWKDDRRRDAEKNVAALMDGFEKRMEARAQVLEALRKAMAADVKELGALRARIASEPEKAGELQKRLTETLRRVQSDRERIAMDGHRGAALPALQGRIAELAKRSPETSARVAEFQKRGDALRDRIERNQRELRGASDKERSLIQREREALKRLEGRGAGREDGRREAGVRPGERKDGERKDGERKDGERKDGERKDGERKDGEARPGADGGRDSQGSGGAAGRTHGAPDSKGAGPQPGGPREGGPRGGDRGAGPGGGKR